jgi:hypothetical protein
MAEVTIEGLERMIDRDAPKYQKVIDDFKQQINDPETHILWALRYPDTVIYAANALRRFEMLRKMVENYRKAVSNVDPEFTAGVTKTLGELTDEAFINHVDKDYTEQLIRYGRSGSSIGQNDLEYQADMKFIATFLDDKLFRWL